MKARSHAALALVAACAAALTAWLVWSSRAQVASPGPELALLGTPAPDLAGSVAPGHRAEASHRVAFRSADEAQEPALASADPPGHAYVLLVRGLDALGFAADAADVRVAPAHASGGIAAVAGCGAWAAFAWRGKLPEMEVDVAHHGEHRRVRVRAGVTNEIALLLPSGAAPDAGFPPPPGARTALGSAPGRAAASAAFTDACLAFPDSVRAPAEECGLETDGRVMQGDARISASTRAELERRIAKARAELPAPAPGGQAPPAFAPGSAQEAPGLLILQGHVRPTAPALAPPSSAPSAAPRGARVRVRILDEHGQPAGAELVELARQDAGSSSAARQSRTDAGGAAEFAGLAAGSWRARAGGGARGTAQACLDLDAGADVAWEARLARGARLFGRVVDETGKPVVESVVRFEARSPEADRAPLPRAALSSEPDALAAARAAAGLDLLDEARAPWIAQTMTARDGSFELSNLPRIPGTLAVLGGAWHVEEGVAPSELALEVLVARTPGEVRVRVAVDPADVAPLGSPRLEVLVHEESTGRVRSLLGSLDEGFLCAALAPGWHRVEVVAGALGRHELGRHRVGARERVDLGSFALPAPARLRILRPDPEGGPAPALELALHARRADVDVRGVPGGLESHSVLCLPAGEYVAVWRDPVEGAIRRRELALRAGEHAELDLRRTAER